jgi:hypothetical protein
LTNQVPASTIRSAIRSSKSDLSGGDMDPASCLCCVASAGPQDDERRQIQNLDSTVDLEPAVNRGGKAKWFGR